jgi:hypothetical protein
MGPSKDTHEAIEAASELLRGYFRLRKLYPSLDDFDLIAVAKTILQSASTPLSTAIQGGKTRSPRSPEGVLLPNGERVPIEHAVVVLLTDGPMTARALLDRMRLLGWQPQGGQADPKGLQRRLTTHSEIFRARQTDEGLTFTVTTTSYLPQAPFTTLALYPEGERYLEEKQKLSR